MTKSNKKYKIATNTEKVCHTSIDTLHTESTPY